MVSFLHFQLLVSFFFLILVLIFVLLLIVTLVFLDHLIRLPRTR